MDVYNRAVCISNIGGLTKKLKKKIYKNKVIINIMTY